MLAAPTVWGRLRKLYACPPSCGAAAVIVCTPAFARRHGLRDDVAILAQVMGSDTATDLDHPNVPDTLGRSATKRVATIAYDRAGAGPEDIDVAEIHDCFVSNEMITCALLGFCTEEGIEQFVRSGANLWRQGGRLPVRRAPVEGTPARRDGARTDLRADLAPAQPGGRAPGCRRSHRAAAQRRTR